SSIIASQTEVPEAPQTIIHVRRQRNNIRSCHNLYIPTPLAQPSSSTTLRFLKKPFHLSTCSSSSLASPSGTIPKSTSGTTLGLPCAQMNGILAPSPSSPFSSLHPASPLTSSTHSSTDNASLNITAPLHAFELIISTNARGIEEILSTQLFPCLDWGIEGGDVSER